MTLLIYTSIGLISFWFLWVFFLAVMELRAVRDAGGMKKGDDAYYIGMSVLLAGLIVDFTTNMLFAPIFFMEWPIQDAPPKKILWFTITFETTVTERVTRLKQEGGWRGDIARWMCAKILDPFQRGGHCN